MIASRSWSFIRVGHACKLANTHFLSENSIHFFQGYKGYHCLNYLSNTMDRNKKQKMFRSVWRPISTQSDENEDDGVQCTTSSSVSDAQDSNKNGERVAGLSISRHTQLEGEESVFSEDVKVDSANYVNSAGRYSVSVEVAASLIRFVKGKGGSTQRQIEGETGAKIVFPSSRKENFIVIEGASSEIITKASEKVHVILEEAVKSPNLDYSHFISLPLAVHPELVDKLINFQNSILGASDSSKAETLCSESDGDTSNEAEDTDQQLDKGPDVAVKLKVVNQNEQVKVDIKKILTVSYPPKASKSSNLSDLGIDKSIFINPKTFHLTVLMLKLWNRERITAATEVLKGVASKVVDALEGRPVFVRLKGLECMRGSLAKARVLYTPVEVIGGEDRLLHACQVITDAYVEAGLVFEKDARQKLKLHGTVMNARHRKGKKMTKRFDSFDARSIVERYGSEDWGKYMIREAHLSQRFMFDDYGYYHRCASIPFPKNKQVLLRTVSRGSCHVI